MITTSTRIAILGTHDWASRAALKEGLRYDLQHTSGPFHITSSNAYAFNVSEIFQALKLGQQVPALDTPIDVLAELLNEEDMAGQAGRIHVHASYALGLPFDPNVNADTALKRIRDKLPKEVVIDDLRLHGLYAKVKAEPQPLEFSPQSVTVVDGNLKQTFEGGDLHVTLQEQGGPLKRLKPLDWQAEVPALVGVWDENPGLRIGACNVSPKDVIAFESEVNFVHGQAKRQRPYEEVGYTYEFDACPYADTLVLRKMMAESDKRFAIGFRVFGSIELRKPEGLAGLSVEDQFRLAGCGMDALYYRSQHQERREQGRKLVAQSTNDQDWRDLANIAVTEGWTCSFFQNMDSGNKPQW